MLKPKSITTDSLKMCFLKLKKRYIDIGVVLPLTEMLSIAVHLFFIKMAFTSLVDIVELMIITQESCIHITGGGVLP